MTVRLMLESPRGNLDLDGIASTGKGVQATLGATGFGLPSRQLQWIEGAGDGATYRGRRVVSRDIDLPLYYLADDREELKAMLDNFSLIVSGECTLRLIDDATDEAWYLIVQLVGGGDYAYGSDTIGELDFETVATFRAGDPYWTSANEQLAIIDSTSVGRGLLQGSLANMKMGSGRTLGEITLTNNGTADAYPVWKVHGPGSGFEAISSTGERFKWLGTLLAGDVLTIDTKTGIVVDQLGDNRYADMDTAPILWKIPPGTMSGTADLTGATSASRIEVSWRVKKWMVV